MAEPHVITALKRKRAELLGEIRQIDRHRQSLRTKLTHLDETLKMVGYDGDFSEIKPRLRHARMFKNGELKRFVSDCLRKSAVTNREMAALMIQRKAWDQDDEELLGLVAGKIKDVRKRTRL